MRRHLVYMEGTGVVSTVKKYVKDRYNEKRDQVSQLFGITQMNTDAQKLLKQYGNQRITAARIVRTPLSNLLVNLIDTVSFGRFKQQMQDQPYEKLFHLGIWLTVGNATLCLEKNERVSLTIASQRKGSETMDVAVPSTTLQQLFDNTQRAMGDRFYTYSAKNNNCQDFILSICRANGFSNQNVESFVKQSVSQLFSAYLRGLSQTTTDTAGKVSVLREVLGRGIQYTMNLECYLSAAQKRKISRGEPIQLSADALHKQGVELQLTERAAKKVASAKRRYKGVRLSPDDLVHGSGIRQTLGKIGSTVSRVANQGANVVEQAKKIVPQSTAKSLATAVLGDDRANHAIDVLYNTNLKDRNAVLRSAEREMIGFQPNVNGRGLRCGDTVHDCHGRVVGRIPGKKGGSISSFFKSVGSQISGVAKQALPVAAPILKSVGTEALTGVLISSGVPPAAAKPIASVAANAGVDALNSSVQGAGMRRPPKGSQEAKEWGARMRAARMAKHGGSFKPVGEGFSGGSFLQL